MSALFLFARMGIDIADLVERALMVCSLPPRPRGFLGALGKRKVDRQPVRADHCSVQRHAARLAPSHGVVMHDG